MSTYIVCPLSDTFDPTGSAVLYSQRAGVLAGFAFVALTFILTSIEGRGVKFTSEAEELRSEESHIVLSLVCALLALIITAVLYAVLGAERHGALLGGRASSEEVLSGVAFGFAVIALLYAIMLLVPSARMRATQRRVRLIFSILAPPLTMLFIGFAGQDFAFAEILRTRQPIPPHLVDAFPKGTHFVCGGASFFSTMTQWVTFLPIGVFVACLLMWMPLGGRHFTARLCPRRFTQRARNAVPYLSLTAVLTAAVWSAWWSERDPGARLTHPELYGWLLCSAVVLVLQAAFMRWAATD
jgi:hypothetical protein